jgi:hypothetical protein
MLSWLRAWLSIGKSCSTIRLVGRTSTVPRILSVYLEGHGFHPVACGDADDSSRILAKLAELDLHDSVGVSVIRSISDGMHCWKQNYNNVSRQPRTMAWR